MNGISGGVYLLLLTACAATGSMWSTLHSKTNGPAWSSGGAARAAPGEETRLPEARTVSKAGLWATGHDQVTVACHNLPRSSGVHFCSVYMERMKGP